MIIDKKMQEELGEEGVNNLINEFISKYQCCGIYYRGDNICIVYDYDTAPAMENYGYVMTPMQYISRRFQDKLFALKLQLSTLLKRRKNL